MNLGLANFHNRLLDNVLGRFTTVDPMSQLASGWTPYRFGFNNPMSYTDPTGMFESSNTLYNEMSSQSSTSNNKQSSTDDQEDGPTNEYVKDKNTGKTVQVSTDGGDVTDNVYEGTVNADGTVVYDRSNPTVLNVEVVSNPNLENGGIRIPGLKVVAGGNPAASIVASPVEYLIGLGILKSGYNALRSAFYFKAAKGVTSLEKASGSYILEFQSGKFYAGKGLKSRMMQSVNRIETKFGDKLLNKTFYPAANSKTAFLHEHNLMMQFGGPKSFDKLSPTYNLIFSPGKKLGGF
ncbi:MAG: RHS repeat-associated core domain-containing protein, partial [Cyclobacteriaceae bacterium]